MGGPMPTRCTSPPAKRTSPHGPAGNVDGSTREKMVRQFRTRYRIFHKLLARRNW